MQSAWLWILCCLCAFSGCAFKAPEVSGPKIALSDDVALRSPSYVPLSEFPPRDTPVTIAVYAIPDKTGANSKTENFAEFSKAVTQGADALVVEALSEIGGGSWFTIVERDSIEPLLQERRMAMAQAEDVRQREHAHESQATELAAQMRIDSEIARLRKKLLSDFQNATSAQLEQMPSLAQAMDDLKRHEQSLRSQIKPSQPYNRLGLPSALQSMTIADYLVTGAIVSHDSDVISGGTGFRLQNIGILQRVQKDVITVSLRLVEISSGEIVANKTASQTVLSTNHQGDVLNYITLNKILEFESGVVTNEPRSLALDAAFRLALSEMMLEMSTDWP